MDSRPGNRLSDCPGPRTLHVGTAPSRCSAREVPDNRWRDFRDQNAHPLHTDIAPSRKQKSPNHPPRADTPAPSNLTFRLQHTRVIRYNSPDLSAKRGVASQKTHAGRHMWRGCPAQAGWSHGISGGQNPGQCAAPIPPVFDGVVLRPWTKEHNHAQRNHAPDA